MAVCGARNWIPPAEIEDTFFPNPSDMIDTIHQFNLPLQGYKPSHASDAADRIRREKLGV